MTVIRGTIIESYAATYKVYFDLSIYCSFSTCLTKLFKTLYDFLSLAPTASWNQLCEAADSMKKKILAKGDKTGRDNAVQSLCGLCVVIFKDVASKKKYDNYVNLTKYRAVNEAVDELALSNQKRIEPKMKESLIDIAVRQYHVSVSDASVYINHYCEYMGYALPENKIVCGLCGTENPAGTTNCVKCGKPLIIPCPACSAENNNSAKVCAKCGFDLTKMDKAVELLRQAKQKYSEKALEEAERLVKEAKAYWPNHADVLGLEKTIQDERKQAADTIAAIMKDIQDNLHTPTPTLLKTRSCTTPFLRFVLVFIRKQLALMKPSLLSERLQI